MPSLAKAPPAILFAPSNFQFHSNFDWKMEQKMFLLEFLKFYVFKILDPFGAQETECIMLESLK